MTSQSEVPPPAPERATYTVDELAALLQCSTRHVHRLTDAREIPGVVRIGRLVRYSRRVIHDWLDLQVAAKRPGRGR